MLHHYQCFRSLQWLKFLLIWTKTYDTEKNIFLCERFKMKLKKIFSNFEFFFLKGKNFNVKLDYSDI